MKIEEELNKIKQLISQNKRAEVVDKLKQLSSDTSNYEDLIEIAHLFQQLGEYGEGINTCNKILKQNPDYKKAKALKDLLTELLKFTQLDIYAATNLWNDPWFE